MFFSPIFDIDKDIIKIYYHKNVKLLCQDLIDIALEHGGYVDLSKRHHLILEIAITGFKDCFPFIIFFNLHLMIGLS